MAKGFSDHFYCDDCHCGDFPASIEQIREHVAAAPWLKCDGCDSELERRRDEWMAKLREMLCLKAK